MMIFQTERLLFRHLEGEDLAALYELYRDPEIRKYYPDGVRTLEETREELEWFLNGHPDHPKLGLWACLLKETGEFVGRSGLLPWEIDGELEIEIAYMIDKRFWRQGLGGEAARGLVKYAFESLSLPRVIALMDQEHEATIRTAISAGLTYVKTIVMDGVSSVVYSRQNQG
jgi:ribosomal-protein-alanine N-acetyltransferase